MSAAQLIKCGLQYSTVVYWISHQIIVETRRVHYVEYCRGGHRAG